MIIRKARSSDCKGIYELACTVQFDDNPEIGKRGFLFARYSKRPEYFCEGFSKDIKKSKYRYVVIENKRIVGFILGCTLSDYESGTILKDVRWNSKPAKLEEAIMINKIAIHSKYSGQGIASLLLSSMEKDMKLTKDSLLFAEIVLKPVHNIASVSFFKKKGFKQIGSAQYPGNSENIGSGKKYCTGIYEKNIF